MGKIMDWTVVRSGARQTVTGKDSVTGDPVKLTNIERVQHSSLGTVAVRGEERFNLA